MERGSDASIRPESVAISAWSNAETLSSWNGIFTTIPFQGTGIDWQRC